MGHMANRTDLAGQQFSRLTVIGLADTVSYKTQWFCRCECGDMKIVRGSHLTSGAIVSCGCHRREVAASRAPTMNLTHGDTSGTVSPEHRCWSSMKSRCTDPNSKSFPNYGARGIDVDPRWLASFEAFLGDVGRRPTPAHSLDRIDNDRGYWPQNVRWATKSEQAQNRRRLRGAAHKLNAEQVKEIRAKRAAGFLLRELAAEYGVSMSQISLIARRKEWDHID